MHTGVDVASCLLDDYATDVEHPVAGAEATDHCAEAVYAVGDADDSNASGTTVPSVRTEPIAMPRPVALHAAFNQSIRNSPYATAGVGAFGPHRADGCATLVGTPTDAMLAGRTDVAQGKWWGGGGKPDADKSEIHGIYGSRNR